MATPVMDRVINEIPPPPYYPLSHSVLFKGI